MPEPPRTGDAVLELVRRAEITDDDALSGFVSRSGPLPPTASDTATRLVQAGILTPFQAKLILQGKHKGFRLGPYRILNQIGAGGMGTVFLAEHAALRRKVALKVLPGRQALDPVNVERFYREARAAATLDHPNIVHAYDVACDKGTHFLVLEYIDGETLDRTLTARGRLPVGEAVSYAVQAAAGLQHAHDKGVAHRDIKPANLLVGGDGIVKVLDLGLAEFFEESGTKLARNSGLLATTDYAAPEQLRNCESADHRADIYNLGATLYHLLTGRPPFAGTTAAKMIAHQLTPVVPPRELRDEIPEALSDVVEVMLAKEPGDRYPTAGVAVQALLPFVNVPDRHGQPSGKLPPLAAAAVQESTGGLDVGPIREAAAAAEALARAQRTARLAITGMIAGVLFGLVWLAVAVVIYLAK
ncbi:Serine/threonine-protein kinase PrkC [Gemmata obscuriglobus]|nr:serine/threonine-protein kinase [Gemmata obscuriglobus]QEG32417.1 Serine/threonine-protein kinase PrkC [Gemmata obscuriglobus]VTS11773.1 serine threonine protein kinase : Putative serine/threonine protein kinase OS=Gemmata sp. Wa1-1 PE=3 SV=1: Pkinase [Gemmata obscuriglobus UQM 2246]